MRFSAYINFKIKLSSAKTILAERGIIMSRAKHFSVANLLWNNTAYCDQWKKVMAVYDERSNLRAVIKEVDNSAYYDVLLIGDNEEALFEINDIELGTTNKNMRACFDIYYRLQDMDTPSYVPSYHRVEGVKLYGIFTHTRAGAKRHGGFRVTTDDISDKINEALRRYEEIISGDVEVVECCGHYGRVSYPDVYYGEAGRMYHIGDGVYCDDGGDNWDFF